MLLHELRRRGSVLAVGSALNYSPSTVSQQLRVLEKETGAPLIERSGRGVRLTEQGTLLSDHARRIFEEVERAEAAVAAVGSTAAGDVRVAALQTAALAILPEALHTIEKNDPHPRTFVSRIEPGRALSALSAREFDIVLGEEYPGRLLPREAGVEMSSVLTDPLVLVVPRNYGGTLDAETLIASSPWVMEPLGSHARSWCVNMCREFGVEPEVRFESDDLLVQMRLVETGHAIAVLPQLLLDSEKPDLTRVNLPGNPSRNVFAAYRKSVRRSPAIRLVLDAFSEATVRFTTAGDPHDY